MRGGRHTPEVPDELQEGQMRHGRAYEVADDGHGGDNEGHDSITGNHRARPMVLVLHLNPERWELAEQVSGGQSW